MDVGLALERRVATPSRRPGEGSTERSFWSGGGERGGAHRHEAVWTVPRSSSCRIKVTAPQQPCARRAWRKCPGWWKLAGSPHSPC